MIYGVMSESPLQIGQVETLHRKYGLSVPGSCASKNMVNQFLVQFHISKSISEQINC